MRTKVKDDMISRKKDRTVEGLTMNKSTNPSIYIRHEDDNGGGQMGQVNVNVHTNEESLSNVILDQISEALSFGIAKSLVESAVESLNTTDITQEKSRIS
jgi:hypothetical protein